MCPLQEQEKNNGCVGKTLPQQKKQWMCGEDLATAEKKQWMCGEDLATALFSVGFVPGTVWITGNVQGKGSAP